MSKNIIATIIVLVALLLVVGNACALEFSFENYAAGAIYGEDASSGCPTK